MATKTIRSRSIQIGVPFVLATADDLDGTADNTQAADITGAQRILIYVDNTGTLGTAGIDYIQISHDGGVNWTQPSDILAITADDVTGTVLATDGALMAAGVEPLTASTQVFKAGPYDGPTAIRVQRKTSPGPGTTWVTGSPNVSVVAIGLGSGTLTALA